MPSQTNPYTDAELLAELIARNEGRQAQSIADTKRGNFYTGHVLHGLRNAAWMVAMRDAEERGTPIITLEGKVCVACRWHGPYLMEPCEAHRVAPEPAPLIPHPGRVSDAADAFEKAGPQGVACEWGDLKPWVGRAMAFCAGYVLATKDAQP